MEYKNGVRLTALEPEKTFLDKAIDEIENQEKLIKLHSEQAKRHVYSLLEQQLEEAQSESQKINLKKKAEERLKDIQAQLDIEKERLNGIASVQTQLHDYREAGRKALEGSREERQKALAMMEGENHHPVNAPNGVLEDFMLAVGVPKPSPYHTAHHIVPGKGKIPENKRTRSRLHRYGIRINDPDNGVYLPRSTEWIPTYAVPDAKAHNRYHTHGYERYLFRAISAIRSPKGIRTHLRIVATMLRNNQEFPDE